jgi:hypothetical protein
MAQSAPAKTAGTTNAVALDICIAADSCFEGVGQLPDPLERFLLVGLTGKIFFFSVRRAAIFFRTVQ